MNPVSRQTQRIVEGADLDEFLGRYISARNLALQHSMYLGDLTATLRRLGIAPAFEAEEVKATFFKVSEVVDLNFP